MIQVIKNKVRHNGKVYTPPDILKNLSDVEEKRLISMGYAKAFNIQEELKEEGIDITEVTVEEAKKQIDKIENAEELEALKTLEAANKNRSTLLEYLDEALAEFEPFEGEDVQ